MTHVTTPDDPDPDQGPDKPPPEEPGGLAGHVPIWDDPLL